MNTRKWNTPSWRRDLSMLVVSSSLLIACGDDAPKDETTGAAQGDQAPADADDEEEDEPVVLEDEDEGVEAAPITSNREGIDRYKYWSPVPAFLRAPVSNGAALGASSAVVVTKDNHTGVTRDAGQNWVFSRHTNGYVLAVGGYEAGPWVAVGSEGYIAVTRDGSAWTSLPRTTSEDLVAVHAGPLGIFAAGKKGAVVHYDKEGEPVSSGSFPDKFKAYAFVQDGDMLVASAGKKAYGSIDGSGWAQLSDPPSAPGGKSAATSAGVCSLASVEKRKKGVVCSVRGDAFGLPGNAAAVVNKSSIALTRDAGATWSVGQLPGSGVLDVFGKSGGPYYAIGSRGLVMTSDDAETWSALEFEESATLWSGMFEGNTGLIVGEAGTILVTTNGGESWDYAEVPVEGKFRWVGKVGGKFVVTDGSALALSSSNGTSWSESADIPELPTRGEDCEGLPAAGKTCAYTKTSTTPPELGGVSSFRFDGDRGLAMGDSGLVAISLDGGASWRASGGLGLGAIIDFDVKDGRVIATDGRNIAVSTEGAADWTLAAIDAKKPDIRTVAITSKGIAVAGGRSGNLFYATGEWTSFAPATTRDKDRTSYVGIYEGAGAIFAAGSKGELWRSIDGLEYESLGVGLPQSLVALAGEGDHLFGLTRGERRYRVTSSLVESTDGGQSFAVVGKPYVGRSEPTLSFADGRLVWGAEFSTDGGKSWRREPKSWAGTQPLFDGSDARISLRAPSEETGGLFIHDADHEGVTEIISVFTQGGDLKCAEGLGCWMLAGGTLYRPSP